MSISVAPGDVVGLVGPNGSGKSTLLNIASGYYAPDRGQVMLGDRDVTRLALHHRVRLGLLPAFQTAQLMDTRSIRDNLTVGGVARARWGRTTSTELVDQVASVLDIGISLETPAGGLPEGTRKVVELGRTLLGAPKVLLLDEPTSGLSLEEVERVAGILRMLGESGVTVLLADHNFEFVGRVCRRLVVLDRGKVLAEGHPDALRADPAVIESYLGSGHEDGAGDGRAAGALRD